MRGICKLYDIETKLQESHVYPKFVISYFKKTGSRYIRNYKSPNVRKQDGLKLYLLSEKAEQEFSKREKWFAENIFYNYLDHNKNEFKYNENLYYFIASLLWRVLVKQLTLPSVKEQPFYGLLSEVEVEWKNFLRGNFFPVNYDRFYLYFTDRVKSHNLDATGVDYYMTRAIDSTIVFNGDGTFLAVYAKFLKFTFWGIIIGGDDSKIFETKVDPIKGILAVPQMFNDVVINSFFYSRIKEIEKLPKPNELQQEKILEEFMRNKNSFLKSDAGQAMMNDWINLDIR